MSYLCYPWLIFFVAGVILPLWLRGLGAPVRVDFEAAYTEARQRSWLG